MREVYLRGGPGNAAGGHIRVRCRTPGCPAVWYDLRQNVGTEVTGRPGRAAIY
jgi:hypothetical protein